MFTPFTRGGLSKSRLEVITAGAGDVLAGKIIVDKNGNPLTGTMPNKGSWDCTVGIGASVTIPKGYHDGTGVAKNSTTNRGAWSGTVGVNGSVTIPEGYHNGSGKVTNSVATMSGQTITPSSSQQTVSCSGKYMTGNIVVKAAQLYRSWSGNVTATKTASYRENYGGSEKDVTYYYIEVTGFNFTVASYSVIGQQASGSGYLSSHTANDAWGVCVAYRTSASGATGQVHWPWGGNISVGKNILRVPVKYGNVSYAVRIYGY